MADDKNTTHYFLDANPEEAERLELSQEIISDHMGRAVWAPIDLSQPGLKILDSATASGIWLQHLRATLPAESGNTYIGTDITPMYFSPNPGPGVRLSVHSMKEAWPADWNGTFDLVHQRMALPAAGNASVKQVIANMIGLLKPGGWIQFVESDHSVVEGPAMADMFRLICDVFKVMDTAPDYAPKLAGWFEELGLVNVGQSIFDVPLGAKNPKAGLRDKSTRAFVLATKGMVQVAQDIPTSFSAEELARVVPNIETELSTQGGVHRLHCVWGQRPGDQDQADSQ